MITISQALATLKKIGLSRLLIIERGVAESLSSSVIHQRKAFVSKSTCIERPSFRLQRQQGCLRVKDGRRLSGNGISKKMSPHRIRHSSITAALDATDGNIRQVQKLSRHANINTLMTYDDNRVNYQEEISQILDDLV